MITSPWKSRTLLVLIVLLALGALFAEFFIIEELDHDHTGEQCPVCMHIEIARRLLETFVRIVLTVLAAVCAVHAEQRIGDRVFRPLPEINPVVLKIKITV